MKSLGDGSSGMDWRFHASIQFCLSRHGSSFALPCQNARRRGYSVGEVGVDPELLPSRESDQSIQNGEARGELGSHSSRVRVFNTCNTRMRLLRMM